MELAKRGHKIHVVTNANEVEPNFKSMLIDNIKDEADVNYLHQNIELHETLAIKENAFIPYSNPYSTKLLGAGIDVLSNHNIDLIIGWYFEPYGIVASQLGLIYNKPVILKHAGSDLGKLSNYNQLKSTYRWMLQSADCLLTNNHSIQVSNLLDQLDSPENKRIHIFPSRIPKQFLSSVEKFKPQILKEKFTNWVSKLKIDGRLIQNVIDCNNISTYDPSLPTIGILGKIGEVKGTYNLIEALIKLRESGLKFNFCSMNTGKIDDLTKFYSLILNKRELSNCTSFFPPVFPHLVPQYIKLCDIVCCLERDFPIEIHAPQNIREILAVGSCLIVSKEVASKQPYYNSLVDNKNCIIIEDPKNESDLQNKLSKLLQDKLSISVIGKHGKYLSHTFENLLTDHNSISTAIEDLGHELNGTYSKSFL
ncbi:MAG: glycosyltransferase [Flavobacterium sp. JAD_PAG50586_2]|nr:MAG: glycosyltransferase [Flavobacterium sp. JAD_PAG50586_2]